MSAQPLDTTRSEAFAENLIDVLNKGAMALMTSIGYQTGLFDTMAELAPSSSEQIAQAAGLNERYVREWLGAMTTGGFVEYDANGSTYRLPPEHAAWTTRAAGINNIAAEMQFISLLATVEQGIIDSFRTGGGVPYSEFGRFQYIMAESSANTHNDTLIDTILPLADVVDALHDGIKVLDVGCGQGHAVNLMAQAFPNSQFRGYDFSQEGIEAGKAEAAALGLSNTHHEVRDVANINEIEQYDFITAFDSIHDQAQPRKVLRSIYEALKPGQPFLMVDIRASSHVHENIDHPLGPYLYMVSTMHCMTVSLALNGEGLGTVWGEQKAQELLNEAGFINTIIKTVDGDFMNNYYLSRKP